MEWKYRKNKKVFLNTKGDNGSDKDIKNHKFFLLLGNISTQLDTQESWLLTLR